MKIPLVSNWATRAQIREELLDRPFGNPYVLRSSETYRDFINVLFSERTSEHYTHAIPGGYRESGKTYEPATERLHEYQEDPNYDPEYTLGKFQRRIKSQLNEIMNNLEKEGNLNAEEAQRRLKQFLSDCERRTVLVVTSHFSYPKDDTIRTDTSKVFRLPYIPEDAVRRAA